MLPAPCSAMLPHAAAPGRGLHSVLRVPHRAAPARCLALLLVMRCALAELPRDLSNLESRYPCSRNNGLALPKTAADVQALVAAHEKVRAVGRGDSWNPAFFCAAGDAWRSRSGSSIAAANGSISSTSSSSSGKGAVNVVMLGYDESIKLDTAASTVAVTCGVTTTDLLAHLGGLGWTLRAVPWWVGQTICGAVATGSHGSSWVGGVSSQVAWMDVVLSNGTLTRIDSATRPDLLRAFRVAGSRLGVTVTVALRVVPNELVERRRSLFNDTTSLYAGLYPETVFINAVSRAQEVYKALGTLDGSLEGTIVFWYPQGGLNETGQPSPLFGSAVNYTMKRLGGVARDDGLRNTPQFQGRPRPDGPPPDYALARRPGALGRGAAVDRSWPQPVPEPTAAEPPDAITSSMLLLNYLNWVYEPVYTGGAWPGILHFSVQRPLPTAGPYTQYEFAVPLESAGDCLAGLKAQFDARPELRSGMHYPYCVRFVGAETNALLSNTHDGPRMYVNLQDHDFDQITGADKRSPEFIAILSYLRSAPVCRGRLHWGKAGWPENTGTAIPDWADGSVRPWSGREEFGTENWCRFGCAVRELDPTGKFSGDSAVWDWRGMDVSAEAACCQRAAATTPAQAAPAVIASEGHFTSAAMNVAGQQQNPRKIATSLSA